MLITSSGMSQYEVLGSRFTVALGDNRFEPDVVVVDPSEGSLEEYEYHGTPILVVEVVSKTSRDYDLGKKRSIYRQYRIPELWFVDYTGGMVEIDTLVSEGYSTQKQGLSEPIKSLILESFSVTLRCGSNSAS